MPRMIDLVRVSALPSNLMHAASRGSLKVPPDEMIEIMVHLAMKNQIFGQQARMTLASWDEVSSKAAASNPKTSKEVLDYLIDPQNLRPVLLPLLLENPSVREGCLVDLMAAATKEIVEVMLKSFRIKRSPRLTEELKKSPHLVEPKADRVEAKPSAAAMAPQKTEIAAELALETFAPVESSEDENNILVDPTAAEFSVESPLIDAEVDEAVDAYLKEHSAELAAEGEKPFKAIGGVYDEIEFEKPEASAEAETKPEFETKHESESKSPAAVIKRPPVKKPPAEDERRGSVLQKIAGLDIKGRIQLAMKGTKEERSILIRDGTKLVALAVLESPKITDGEVERFANQKNVLEAVLRQIPMKRRFAKLYPVVRNLVFNPRSPLDMSLGLMKHLLVQDLKNLSGNKEVSDTVRKLASKNFKSKTDSKK
jgi:hypothetical protein